MTSSGNEAREFGLGRKYEKLFISIKQQKNCAKIERILFETSRNCKIIPVQEQASKSDAMVNLKYPKLYYGIS